MVINNETTIDPELLSRLEKELAALDYTVPEKTQTIKDILKDKKTSCWGISRIALERLKRAGLDPETVYVAEDDDDMRPTHQFTTYRDGDKYRIFDHWVTQQLLDELYPSREAAIDAGVENWRREGHPHSIRAYTGTYIPKPGKDFEEYMAAMEKGNKLLKKYPAMEKSGSKKLSSEINDLLDGYEWTAIDPVSGKKIYSPGKRFFNTSNPVTYSYHGAGEEPFTGNCVEQSLFVREHFPDAKFLFSRDVKPGVNNMHVTPLLKDDKGYYHHVRLNPVEDERGIPQYLSGGRFRNLKNFLKSTAHKWGARDIDYYVLDDIPSEGDAVSLLSYANEHADPVRIRDGRPIDSLRFKKNFKKIVDLYKKLYDIDLSTVKYYEDPHPKYTNGQYAKEIKSKESGGNWEASHSIRINPKMEEVIKHWKLDTKLRPFVDSIIAHELAHDVEHNENYKDFVEKILQEAKEKNFTTPYLKTVKDHKMNSELFAEYMSYLINNNRAPKQIKQAGLDNYWMSLNPETNKYEDSPLEGIKSDSYGSIDPYWFRGKAYGDLVEAISNGSLYGMSHAPREYYDDDDEYESAQEYDWDSYNWLTNKQCRQIYKKLRKLSPRKLRKLRKRFDGIYYIPDDGDVQAFVDQFKKHTDAGHSLLASW